MQLDPLSRILITGGQGFLGKFVEKALRDKGYKNVFTAGGLRQGVDLGEVANVGWLIDYTKPDAVIHLASKHGGISANNKYPGGLMYENLNMGLRIIEEARQYDCKKFINVGDICSYPANCPVPFSEKDFWSGYPHPLKAHYGIAKKTLAMVLDGYKKQFGLDSTTLILTDLYGPNDEFDPHASKFIPSLLTRIRFNIDQTIDTFETWGDSQSTRDFLFIEDAADAVVLALEKSTDIPIINIGSGQETNIKDLTERACKILNYNGNIKWNESPSAGTVRRFLDISRANSILGFSPKVLLNEGIQQTAEWFFKELPPPKLYSSDALPPNMDALR